MRRSRILLVALLVLLAVSAYACYEVPGAAFVARAAGLGGPLGQLAARTGRTVTTSTSQVPWRGGQLPARRYMPNRQTGRSVLLVPGVHAAGIDEPRLVAFAQDLAASGHPVLTMALPDLERYDITARTTDMIEDGASWLIEVNGGRPITMMGISFAGGLSVVAAGRPSVRDHVSAVVALGGHGDLPRTLRYLATGIQADGTHRPPHDYGLAIVLLGLVDRVVPAPQAQPLRDAILTYLEASRLDTVDKPRAAATFERARALEQALPEPSRTLMREVNARDVAALGPTLLPYLDHLEMPAALSPERSPAPAAPVFLLHGTDDNVVPSVESRMLAAHLTAQGARVRLLLTPLVTHAELDRPASIRDVAALVRFWTDVLGR